jgi:hypothetical protein
MAFDNHTVMICTAALRQTRITCFRGLPSEIPGVTYDETPVDSLPGVFSTKLALTLNATSPWLTTPTHYMAATWELRPTRS